MGVCGCVGGAGLFVCVFVCGRVHACVGVCECFGMCLCVLARMIVHVGVPVRAWDGLGGAICQAEP